MPFLLCYRRPNIVFLLPLGNYISLQPPLPVKPKASQLTQRHKLYIYIYTHMHACIPVTRIVRGDNVTPELVSLGAASGGGAERRKRNSVEAVLASFIRHLIKLYVLSMPLIIRSLIMAKTEPCKHGTNSTETP